MPKYIILDNREIPLYGGVCGPLSTPISIDKRTLIDLLQDGYTIYQVNPYDKNDKVKVTLDNYSNILFKRKRASVTSDRLVVRSVQDISNRVTKESNKDKQKENNPNKKQKKNDINKNLVHMNIVNVNQEECKDDKKEIDDNIGLTSDFEK